MMAIGFEGHGGLFFSGANEVTTDNRVDGQSKDHEAKTQAEPVHADSLMMD